MIEPGFKIIFNIKYIEVEPVYCLLRDEKSIIIAVTNAKPYNQYTRTRFAQKIFEIIHTITHRMITPVHEALHDTS